MSPRRPPPPPPPPQPGKRAQLRAQQQRRRRRRVLSAAVGVVVVVALVVGTVLAMSGGGAGHKANGPTRTQHTLLLQVEQPDRTAVSSALLAHDTKTRLGSVILIPPQVLVPLPGVGSVAFEQGLALGRCTGADKGTRDGLADLLGVTVDGSWLLDSTTFEQLVDQLGGVQVAVDVTVLRGRTVLLNPGAQRLTGAQAEVFATYLAAGEQEQARLARLQLVLDGIISQLPHDPSALLRSLGAGSRPSLAIPVLSQVLAGLRSDDQANDLQYRSLPVISLSSGDDQVLFRIDTAAAKTLVSELLSGSIPPGARQTGNRVLVLNGVGTPGLGAVVRDRLLGAGLAFSGSRNAPHFGYPTTQVLVKDVTPEGAAVGRKVAKALGVPDSSVMTSDQFGSIADVVVIVGADFRARTVKPSC